MSDTLKGIAARYAAGLRVVGKLTPVSDARRLEQLRAVWRYGVGINYFITMLDLAERGHGETTWDDLARFVGPQSAGIRKDLGEFNKEELIVGYICTCMAWLFPDLPREQTGVWAGKALDRSALDDVIRLFPTLPYAADYLP